MAKPVYALVNGVWTLVGSTTAHNHTVADVTGLQAAIDAKADVASPTFTGTLTADVVKITGGTPGVGKVLTSDADGDATWETPAESGIQPTLFDAKGDLIVASAADTAVRLAAGTDGQVLTADSAVGTGLKWIDPSVGQVEAWNISNNYTTGDVVNYQNTLYRASQPNIGITPTRTGTAYNTDASANNDMFANRKWTIKTSGGSYQHTYPTMQNAGIEASEPNTGGSYLNSVWYSFYVEQSGTLTIDTSASTGDSLRDTSMFLYQGSNVTALTSITTANVGGTLDQNYTSFRARWSGISLTAGQTYSLQILNYASRNVTLILDLTGTAQLGTPPDPWTPIIAPVVTVNGSASDSSGNIAINAGHTIEDETVAQTQRSKLNFTGDGVTVTDDSGNDRTVVTIPGGGIQTSLFDTKGDILVASAADTPAVLPAGTNGQILLADSAEATGLKWVDSSTITPSYSTDLGAITGGVPVTVTHNLNTYDVVVQILEKNTAGAGGAAGVVTDATIAISSANAVDITFIDAAVANLYRVTVVAVGGTGSGGVGAVQTFTPTLRAVTTNPNLGSTGIALGSYSIVGKMAFLEYTFRFSGTGISSGSGNYWIEYPPGLTVVSSQSLDGLGFYQGSAALRDDSTTNYQHYMVVGTNTGLGLRQPNAAAFASNSSPWTWASGDGIYVQCRVQLA